MSGLSLPDGMLNNALVDLGLLAPFFSVLKDRMVGLLNNDLG